MEQDIQLWRQEVGSWLQEKLAKKDKGKRVLHSRRRAAGDECEGGWGLGGDGIFGTNTVLLGVGHGGLEVEGNGSGFGVLSCALRAEQVCVKRASERERERERESLSVCV